MKKVQSNLPERHSDNIQDIITAVPPWLLRWGITLFFILLSIIIFFSTIIKYPDIVTCDLSITSSDKPKEIVAKASGKVVTILVSNNENVSEGQALAFIESTGKHESILLLINQLKHIQAQVKGDGNIDEIAINQISQDELGELQSAYQTFSQSLISYRTTVKDGFLLKKRNYLEKDIDVLNEHTSQLNSEQKLNERDLKLAEDEFNMHKKLEQQKVETAAEFRQQESKFIAKKSPLFQTKSSLISIHTELLAKQKEIMELDNQVLEERSKFKQALNSLISQAEDWRSKYVLLAPQNGAVVFVGALQKNQYVSLGQDVFFINAANDKYFGEITIPQDNLGKIKSGQRVLIKLKSYPFQEYGVLEGNISYLSDIPYKDSMFIARVDFDSTSIRLRKSIRLREGLVGSAEIITENASIFQRLKRDIVKSLNIR